MRNFIIAVLVLFGFSLIGTFFYYQYSNSPVDSKSKADVEIVIPKGMSTSRIARELKEKKLIRSEIFFKVMVKLDKVSLKASSYLLKKNMTTIKIIKELSDGSTYNPNAINITFREGLRVTDYADAVSKKTKISNEEFLDKIKDKEYLSGLIGKYWFLNEDILNEDIYYPLEGYLAPNTYEFKDKNVTSEEIIEKMLDQTEVELKSYKKQIEEHDHYNIHQLLTFASMAQLEGTDEKSMKMIVGVFINRINSKMNLGSDVTTYYGLQVAMDRDLTAEEFNTANAYNTRSSSKLGLPVGPICNPSMEAIRAALDPDESDYLFFVADKKGKVYYTKTNEEHLKKVQDIKDKGDWIW